MPAGISRTQIIDFHGNMHVHVNSIVIHHFESTSFMQNYFIDA